jgi:hypothetical protein
MRALVGWVLALGLVASPALAAGSGAADSTDAATSNSATSTAKDNSGSTPSAAAKADAPSLESEIGDLRDLIDSQASQLEKQNDQLQQEQKKLEVLEEQLKASSAVRNSVTSSAPASSPVATASVAAPTVPAATPSSSTSSPSAAAQPPQGNGNEPPSPLFFRIGSATFTPLGFIDLTDVFRAPVIGSGIGTNFATVPYRIAGNFGGNAGAVNSGLTEDRLSLQNSRVGFRVDSTVWGGQALGYLETDFLGNSATSISTTSNSVTLRLRVFFLDYTKGKIEILAGQDWSMLTPNRVGINPIPGNIFFSQDMDTNYQVGLVWERTPQFRFLYHASKAAAFGISLENADQYFGGSNGAGSPTLPNLAANTTFTTTSNLDTTANAQIPNVFPDLIVKAAFDPMVMKRDFHFEVSGLLKEFRVNTFISPNTSLNSSTEGGAVSANINFELFKNFHLIANSYWSDGGGQKIFGLAPDVVISPQPTATSALAIRPLHSGSGIGGAEWQVMPKLMVYGYYGGVYIGRDFFNCAAPGTSPGATFCGYGVPASVGGASTGISQNTAYSQNRVVQEGTIGLIPVFWRSPNYGTVQLIMQYSYLSRNPWAVVPVAGGLNPAVAHGSMAWVDLRYVLP